MAWGSHLWGSSIWGGGLISVGTPIRTPIAALYIDNLHFDNSGGGIALINTIPEDGEEQVLSAAHILLQLSAFNFALSNLTKIWVTIGTQAKVLAFDETAGGFQTGWDGPDSSISYKKSPSSTVFDDVLISIDPTTDWPSHTVITIEVEAAASTDTLSTTYSFTTEHTEAPLVDDILWINPRRARLHFRERMQQDDQVGGTLYLKTLSGGMDFVAPNKMLVRNLTPTTDWIGYFLGTTGSAYPQNNGYFKVTAVDAVNGEITVATTKDLKDDDGIDKDADGNVIRNRTLQGVISSYKIEADPASETTDDITCAYEPVITAARAPLNIEIPSGSHADQYVIVDLHDDISISRKYELHLFGAVSEYDEVADATSIHSCTSPSFGFPEKRIRLWDLMPFLDQDEDGEADDQLQKMACVLQDMLNVLWYRCDSLQYLYDPDRAPDSWIPYLLYTLGNPFRLPLNILEQRRLCNVLVTVYKQIGVAKIIEETLTFFIGASFIVDAFQSMDWWTLGTSILGVGTILGPSTKYAKNCYEITASRALTDDERRAVWHIATTIDPAYMHLLRIIEP